MLTEGKGKCFKTERMLERKNEKKNVEKTYHHHVQPSERVILKEQFKFLVIMT